MIKRLLHHHGIIMDKIVLISIILEKRKDHSYIISKVIVMQIS